MIVGPRGERASVPMTPRLRSRAAAVGSRKSAGRSTVRYDQSGIAGLGELGNPSRS